MNILSIGLGQIGCQVANYLAENNHLVYGVSRSKKDNLHQNIKQLTVDVLSEDFNKTIDEIDVAIDCVIVVLTPSDYSEKGYQQGYYDTACAITDVLKKTHKQARVIFISSTSVYAENSGQWCDEHTPVMPNNPKASHLFEAENRYREHLDNACIIRPSGIYGRERLRLINMVLAGKPIKTSHCSNRIFDEDLVGIIANIALADKIEPIYLATDSMPVYQETVLDYLAKKLNQPALKRLSNHSTETGKRLKSLYLNPEWLSFPTWQQGYDEVLRHFHHCN